MMTRVASAVMAHEKNEMIMCQATLFCFPVVGFVVQ
jgi:hypothetical protein